MTLLFYKETKLLNLCLNIIKIIILNDLPANGLLTRSLLIKNLLIKALLI